MNHNLGEQLPGSAPNVEPIPGAALAVELANDLTSSPEEVFGRLEDPFLQGTPELYAGAWAGAQRRYMMGEIKRDAFMRYRSQAEDVLTESGEWRKILRRTARGLPSAHELQLVVWSAQSDMPELKMQQPSKVHKAASKVLLTQIPPLDVWDGQNSHDAWRALRSFVANHPAYGLHFNPPAGHLLAIGQAEFMHGSGLISGLDVRQPNRLALATLKQLEGFMDHTRQSGEYNALPSEVWWTVRALQQYRDDCAAHAAGDVSVEGAQGRAWRFLSEADAYGSYERYLKKRAAEVDHSDQRLRECFIASPQKLNRWLHHFLRLPCDDDRPFLAQEMVGAAWGAIALRRRDPQIRRIIEYYSNAVQQMLEPYVLDGMPLLARREEAQWLSIIALHSWYGGDQKLSVFTPLYGSPSEDYISAGEAMSQNIALRYQQGPTNESDGTKSNGHTALAPQIGIIMAFHQLQDALRVPETPPTMLTALYAQFLETVDTLHKKASRYRVVGIGLPIDVRKAINNPNKLYERVFRRQQFSPRAPGLPE